MGNARNYKRDWEDGYDTDPSDNFQHIQSHQSGSADVMRKANQKAMDQDRAERRATKEFTHEIDETPTT